VILLLFGGKKLPELARGIGRGLSEFRRATHDIQREIQSSIDMSPSTPPTEKKVPSSDAAPARSTPQDLNESENSSPHAS